MSASKTRMPVLALQYMHTVTQTIEVQKILAAKFSDKQAVKILDYVNNKQGDTATKQDLAAVKTELKQDVAAVKQELAVVKQDVAAVKTELKQSVAWLKWALSTLLVFMIGGFTLVAMESIAARQDRREIRRDISEIKENMHKMDKKLDRLIQTQMARPKR